MAFCRGTTAATCTCFGLDFHFLLATAYPTVHCEAWALAGAGNAHVGMHWSHVMCCLAAFVCRWGIGASYLYSLGMAFGGLCWSSTLGLSFRRCLLAIFKHAHIQSKWRKVDCPESELRCASAFSPVSIHCILQYIFVSAVKVCKHSGVCESLLVRLVYAVFTGACICVCVLVLHAALLVW